MNNNKQILLTVFLLVLINAIVWKPSLNNGFVNYDDPVYVYENPYIKQLSAENTKELFTAKTATLYIPLVFLSYSIEYHFFQLSPFVYHLTNLIFHIFNSILVFWLIWLLSKNILIAAVVSILFAIHPMHAESVAWVTERKDVLYSFFYILSLISYHFYWQKSSKKYYVLTFLFFVLACFSKAMAITLPAVLVLYDYFYLKRKLWESIRTKFLFFIGVVFFTIILFKMMGLRGSVDVAESYNFFDKSLSVFYALFFYIQKLILPVNLSVVYPYPVKTGVFLPLIFFIATAFILFITWWIFKSKRSNNIIKACFLFFIITLFPVLQIIPNAATITADRYSYMPSLGVFAIAAYYLNGVIEKKKMNLSIVYLLVSTLIIVYSVGTYNRCKVWENSITLFTDVIKNYQTSDVAYGNLALAYNDKGDFKTAIPLFEKAVKINPDNPEVLNNYGWALSMTGHYEEAIASFKRSISINPKEAKTYNNLANTFGTIGNYNAAIESFGKVLALDPLNVTAMYNLAFTYLKAGDKEQALNYYQQSARLGFKPAQELLIKNHMDW